MIWLVRTHCELRNDRVRQPPDMDFRQPDVSIHDCTVINGVGVKFTISRIDIVHYWFDSQGDYFRPSRAIASVEKAKKETRSDEKRRFNEAVFCKFYSDPNYVLTPIMTFVEKTIVFII